MRTKELHKRLTVRSFVSWYGSKFRGLLGCIPEPEWSEKEARDFYAKHSRRIWAAIDQRGYGHEALLQIPLKKAGESGGRRHPAGY